MPKKAHKSKPSAARRGRSPATKAAPAADPPVAALPATKSKRGGKREGAGRKQLPRHHLEYAAAAGPTGTIADVPKDPLQAVAWAGRLVVLSLYKAATDPNLSEKERRIELRQISKAVQMLVPDTRRAEVDRAMREAQDQMKADRKSPEMTTDVPSVTTEQSGSLRLDS